MFRKIFGTKKEPESEPGVEMIDFKELRLIRKSLFGPDARYYLPPYLRYRHLINLRSTCRAARNAYPSELVDRLRYLDHFPNNPLDLIGKPNVRDLFYEWEKLMKSREECTENGLNFSRAVLDGDINQAKQLLTALRSNNDKYQLISEAIQSVRVPFDIDKDLRNQVLQMVREYFTDNQNNNQFDLNKRDSNGCSYLHALILIGDVETIKILFENHAEGIKPLLEATTNSQRTPLCLAAARGHTALVKLLLLAGAQVNHQDVHGYTPIGLAAGNNHLAGIEILLSAGAGIDHQSIAGRTPLSLVCTGGHLLVVDLLLRHHPNIDLPDKFGVTPLMLAASAGYLPLVLKLLNAGANLSLSCKTSNAMKKGSLKKLIKSQSSKTLKDELTAEDLARIGGYDEVARELESRRNALEEQKSRPFL